MGRPKKNLAATAADVSRETIDKEEVANVECPECNNDTESESESESVETEEVNDYHVELFRYFVDVCGIANSVLIELLYRLRDYAQLSIFEKNKDLVKTAFFVTTLKADGTGSTIKEFNNYYNNISQKAESWRKIYRAASAVTDEDTEKIADHVSQILRDKKEALVTYAKSRNFSNEIIEEIRSSDPNKFFEFCPFVRNEKNI